MKRITVLLLAVLFLAGCTWHNNALNKVPQIEELANRAPEHQTVETMQNLLNGGMVCAAGDWIFFASDGEVCRVKKDGTEFAVLKEYGPNSIDSLQISGKWLYYFEYSEAEWDDYIRRIDLNATEIKELDAINYVRFWAIDMDSIYRISGGGNYFVKSDFKEGKTNTEFLNDIKSFDEDAFLCDGFLYYTDRESSKQDKKTLYKVSLDKPENPQVIRQIELDAFNIIISNNYVYYYTQPYPFEIYFWRMPINQTDNLEPERIDQCDTAIVREDGTILTMNKYAMKSIDPDKEEVKKLLSYSEYGLGSFNPYTIDGEIYLLIGENAINDILVEHCALEQVAGPLYRMTLTD